MRFPWTREELLSPSDVVREFVAFLGEAWPRHRVEVVSADELKLHDERDRESTLFLHKLHFETSHLHKQNAQERRKIYDKFARSMLDNADVVPQQLRREEHQKQILPRLIRDSFLQQLRSHKPDADLPRRAFCDGLSVAYILDFPDRVAYLMNEQAAELSLDEAELYDLALANLRQIFSVDNWREAVTATNRGEAVAVNCPDGHSAARLLLAREAMSDGDEIAVVAPSDSMLIVAPLPPGNNWNALRKMAREGHPSGYNQPFWVRRDEVKLM